MAPKSRAKSGARAGKGGRQGRRPPVRVKKSSDVPILAVAVGSVLAVLLVAMIIYIVYLNRPATPPPSAGGVPCDHLEHTQSHYHAALQIMYHGVVTNLPDDTGINIDADGTTVACYYWLHVHAGQKNIIHIEAPSSQTFTLGQFFDVWNTWSRAKGLGPQKLDSTHVSQFVLAPTDKIVIYVDKGDGKPTVFTGDPKSIVLASHTVVTIEIAPPDVNPPPSFTFPSGL
jgi:hypothetical protein